MNKTYDNTKKLIEFCEYAVHLMIHNLTVMICINEYEHLMLFVKAVDHVTKKFLKDEHVQHHIQHNDNDSAQNVVNE